MAKASKNSPTSRIGPLLRSYRTRIRLTQSHVAKMSGISSSMLSQIESSAVSPSIHTLFAICNTLGMDISYLIKGISPLNPVHIYHPEERSREQYNTTIFETLVSRIDTPNYTELFLMEIQPGQEISLKGEGKDIIALGYVLAGSVSFTVNEKSSHALKQGDSVLFQSLVPHKFHNTGDSTFKAVWSLTPVRPGFQQ